MNADKRGKGARTREHILDVALEAFTRDGFNALSLREIALRAGLTHAGLKHHFVDKEDLLLQVLERRDHLDIETFRRNRVGSGRDLLVWILRIADRNATTPYATSLYARLSNEAGHPSHPAHAHYIDRYARLTDAISAALAEEFARTPPPYPVTARHAARQLIALMDGLQVQWLLHSDEVDMVAELSTYLRGLGIEIALDEVLASAGTASTGTAITRTTQKEMAPQ